MLSSQAGTPKRSVSRFVEFIFPPNTHTFIQYGLVGSTEWAEDFPEWVQEQVVSYINLDVSSAGSRWNAGGSPSLAHLIRDAALTVPHPTDPSLTLWDAREDEGTFEGALDAELAAMYEEKEKKHVRTSRNGKEVVEVPPLGSGSDFTPFLQRLGVRRFSLSPLS